MALLTSHKIERQVSYFIFRGIIGSIQKDHNNWKIVKTSFIEILF